MQRARARVPAPQQGAVCGAEEALHQCTTKYALARCQKSRAALGQAMLDVMLQGQLRG